MKLTKEQIAKARAAKSADELIGLASEYGIEMSVENIKAQFDAMHCDRALSDTELDNVSGGCGDDEEEEVVVVPPQPTAVSCDGFCDHYKLRSGGAGGAYVKFYQGTRCESCSYFLTNPYGWELDPNYDGNGYCYYEVWKK